MEYDYDVSIDSSIDNDSHEGIILSGSIENTYISNWTTKWKHDRLQWDYHVNKFD